MITYPTDSDTPPRSAYDPSNPGYVGPWTDPVTETQWNSELLGNGEWRWNPYVAPTTGGAELTSYVDQVESLDDYPETFPPTSHTHGNLTNDGKIGSTTDQVLVTTTDGAVTTASRSSIDSRTVFPPDTTGLALLSGATFTGSVTALGFGVPSGSDRIDISSTGVKFTSGSNDMTLSVGTIPEGDGAGDAKFARTQRTDGVPDALIGTLTATAYTETVVALGTVAATPDQLAITSGTVITATLTSSTPCTFTMPTAAAGKSFLMHLKQAATPTTATFTGVLWSGGATYAATQTASRVDILSFATTPNAAGNGWLWVGSVLPNHTLP